MSAFGGHAKDALHTYPRHRFDAAKVAVTRATALPASKYVVGCLSFGCTGLLLLGSSIGLALAGFAELIVVAALVAMIPFIAGIVNMRPKTSAAKVLDAMTCPQCRAATTRRVDASTKAYVLVCEQCRVVWETAVPLPGDGDHIHTQTDHHHHHHF